jgi:hypothetical protein
MHKVRDTLSSTVANRRAERTALWQDSSLFQDSFFAPDTRIDGFGSSEYGGLGNTPVPPNVSRRGSTDSGSAALADADSGEGGGGIVSDSPRYVNSRF